MQVLTRYESNSGLKKSFAIHEQLKVPCWIFDLQSTVL